MRYLEKVESLGRHLKKIREERGLFQQASAYMADITQKTILRIENGRNAPTLDLLFAISDALEMPVLSMPLFQLLLKEE